MSSLSSSEEPPLQLISILFLGHHISLNLRPCHSAFAKPRDESGLCWKANGARYRLVLQTFRLRGLWIRYFLLWLTVLHCSSTYTGSTAHRLQRELCLPSGKATATSPIISINSLPCNAKHDGACSLCIRPMINIILCYIHIMYSWMDFAYKYVYCCTL